MAKLSAYGRTTLLSFRKTDGDAERRIRLMSDGNLLQCLVVNGHNFGWKKFKKFKAGLTEDHMRQTVTRLATTNGYEAY